MGKCCSATVECCPDDGSGVPVVSTSLTFKDILGAWKVRWGVGRMDYTVTPGLYAVGDPGAEAPVLVSANYKLTFDALRSRLSGLDCWLLILDTKGVNVWCAAGKGTFGTDELAERVEAVKLAEKVSHRQLILPQLGASGVSAHEVKKQTGFAVVYGPVRAGDIKAFLASGRKATREMRTVQFTMRDRLVLTPVELANQPTKLLRVLGVLFLLNLVAARPFGVHDLAIYLGAVLMGTVITPVFLPFIPGRPFSWKGWLLGAVWTCAALWMFGWLASEQWLLATGYLLFLPAVSADLALDFTGCSTFTSPSGVLKELKYAIPTITGLRYVGAAMLFVKALFG